MGKLDHIKRFLLYVIYFGSIKTFLSIFSKQRTSLNHLETVCVFKLGAVKKATPVTNVLLQNRSSKVAALFNANDSSDEEEMPPGKLFFSIFGISHC